MKTEIQETEWLLSDRVKRLREEVLSCTPMLDTERCKFLYETYRDYRDIGGEAAVIRRARLFERICNEKTIFIDDNLIVGTLTKYLLGAYPFPEIGVNWMKKSKEYIIHLGKVIPTDEDWEWIQKIVDQWKDKNLFARTRHIMEQQYGIDIVAPQKCGALAELSPGGLMFTFPDFQNVLTKGLGGIIAEVKEKRAQLDVGNVENFEQFQFYNASEICLNALITLAQRYGNLASDMAKEETNPVRKEELERIATTCQWVPENPPRDFYEALQAVWFITLGVWIENPVVTNSPLGRFSQYLYPFYERDKEAGKIDEEAAIELLQMFFVKTELLAQLYSPFGFRVSSSRVDMHLSLGGVTPEGEDATNEIDFLVLEAQERLRFPEPTIDVWYHDRLSERFLLKCLELVRTGIGMPAFFNTNVATQRNLDTHGPEGMTLEEARDNIVVGCVQNAISGKMDGLWEGAVNMGKMLEFALNNGRDPLSGLQSGPETGEAESFQSYEDLCQALKKQIEHFNYIARQSERVAWNTARDFPQPFGSSLLRDCIDKGKDMQEGITAHSVGSGTGYVGMVDLGNSLAAIKKLIFEEKKLSMQQLKDALAANFQGDGHGTVQQMLLNAPKYGNDDDYVDSIVKEWYQICWEEHMKLPDFVGRKIKPVALSVTIHTDRGQLTGALPSGREAGIALADASVSAYPGTDEKGPTALVKSATKVLDTVKYATNHFNMKLHPSALEGKEGARKFLSLMKTYMDLGGYHIQFNCVSGETLLDAQLHPEEHRDLVVRVAGFSAFFIHLDETTQDEIIRRTELVL